MPPLFVLGGGKGVRGKRDEVRGTRYESRGLVGVSLWGGEQWGGEVASGTSSVSETRDYG